MQRRIIPDVVLAEDIVALNKNQSVHDAVQAMSTHNIAALAITNGDNELVGIVSERDMTHRVLACGLNPQTTRLEEVMTDNPEALRPTDSCLDATELMLSRNFRHLPVVNGEHQVIAMVSMRDLLEVALEQLNIDIDDVRQEAFAPEDD